MVWAWGQFIDHDITLTHTNAGAGTLGITVNAILPGLIETDIVRATGPDSAEAMGLGTYENLIEAFTAVANANPAEKADLLSASISVAMNTTAFGLIVAIPLLVTNQVLMAKTSEIIDSLEMASLKALNVISANAKRRVEA